MAYKYKAAPKTFSDAAGASSVLHFPHKKSEPVQRAFLFALPGGGALTQAQAGAIPAVYETLAKYGIVKDWSGTSGGALNGAVCVDAINRGLGLEGIKAALDQLWTGVRNLDTVYGVSKFQRWFRTAADQQGNLPQAYLDLTKVFSAASLGQIGVATTRLKDVLDAVVQHNYKFIQADIQGHESDCFVGGANTLKQDRPEILCESLDEELPQVAEFLTTLNYSGYFFLQGRLTPLAELPGVRSSIKA